MKCRIGLFACVPLLVFTGCGEEPPLSPAVDRGAAPQPTSDLNLVARGILEATNWPTVDEDGNALDLDSALPQSSARVASTWVERHVVIDDIVHYGVQLRVGPGPHDLIGLHRVIRERAPYVPIRTRYSVFLLHGGGKDFVGNFMPGMRSQNVPDDFGMAVHLAQGDIDVWGLDARSTQVSWQGEEAPFMASWGMDTHLMDLGIGMQLARILRLAGGNGWRAMVLSGYSSAAVLGYAFLGQETRLAPALRSVSGYIPVEYGMKSDNPAVNERACASVAETENLMSQGIYGGANLLPLIGIPARDDPDGPSGFVAGLTNLQAALSLEAWPINDPLTGHFAAGVFDANGIATALQYQTTPSNLDFLCESPAYDQPVAFSHDIAMLTCPSTDAPWDDYLADISVPILLIVAAGGYGIDYNDLDYVGSTDRTEMVVSLHPADEVLLDYGHIDPYNAENALSLVWQPVADWIEAHAAP